MPFILVAFAGEAVVFVVFFALIYRLGRFRVTRWDVRSWAAWIAGVATAGILFSLISGRFPFQVIVVAVLALNIGVITCGWWLWHNRRRFAANLGRFAEERRAEAARRQQWMRQHRPLLIGMFVVFLAASAAWPLVLISVFASPP